VAVNVQNTAFSDTMPCSLTVRYRHVEKRVSPSSKVKMKAELSAETSVNFYQTTLRHIPEDDILER
jgi:hypothetical protein